MPESIYYNGLIIKLIQFGICGETVALVPFILARQTAKSSYINGCASDWVNVNAGVSQGPILGPLLYLVYANDVHV